ncbi:MAG: hypothetical protein ACQETH_12200 [Candidatus Rifleibacteriota bacterium]
MSLNNAKLYRHRRGLAIPLVLVFTVCIMVYASSLVFFRKESKQQNLTNIHFIQANFLAQSAIQMMLLKISAYPQEACDAGVLSMGYCPFRAIIAGDELDVLNTGNPEGLQQFAQDCNTDAFPLKIPDIDPENWKFNVEDFKVISAYTNPGEKQLIISAQITSLGEATMARGGMGTRKEEMIKTIKLTRQN